jgi:hypothetical protein
MLLFNAMNSQGNRNRWPIAKCERITRRRCYGRLANLSAETDLLLLETIETQIKRLLPRLETLAGEHRERGERSVQSK